MSAVNVRKQGVSRCLVGISLSVFTAVFVSGCIDSNGGDSSDTDVLERTADNSATTVPAPSLTTEFGSEDALLMGRLSVGHDGCPYLETSAGESWLMVFAGARSVTVNSEKKVIWVGTTHYASGTQLRLEGSGSTAVRNDVLQSIENGDRCSQERIWFVGDIYH